VTVAAVILFSRGPEGALADAAGRPVARRAVESAWAGGATPIVIVCADPDGTVAAALAGSTAVLAEPAPVESGPVGQMINGMKVALGRVTETDAAFIWPGRMAWIDAETITTMIEAHGAQRDALLRPRYGDELGWPALIPMSLLDSMQSLATDHMPDVLMDDLIAGGAAWAEIDTGDPGTHFDISTPMDQLPAYQGPPEPVGGHAPEWGASAADMPDDAPLEGPSLAPYGQASDEGD
jgi:CTP:molybdopterin cytidylyltransferase MocA